MSNARLYYDASPEIREVISRISRTEDIRLSPDNSRLAIVDFVCNRLFLFSIRIHVSDVSGASPNIRILDYSIITSDSFSQPHGVAFLDNEHLIVCNRAADVCLFRIPVPGETPRERDLKPHSIIRGRGFLRARVKTPGSVDYHALGGNRYRMLVCNNHWHFVSSHTVELGDTVRIRHEGTLIQEALRIPDGVSISPDAAWIAISNHVDGEIVIYGNTPDLDRATPPAAALKGIVCPHGVRFSPDGKVLVADAASQYLHVYDHDNGKWTGERYPSMSIRILDDKTFYDGRYDSREGGLKGIDIDTTGRVLVTTHRFGVLEFYDLSELLSGAGGATDTSQIMELCRQRDESLERQRAGVMNRRWTLKTRTLNKLRELRRELKERRYRLRKRWQLLDLRVQNRWSRESILDPSGPVLSMTSHTHRLGLVFYALESIAMGVRKPARIILWLTDEASCASPPETLQRLVSRGLEIRYTEEFGPHTKYWPYIDCEDELNTPLVTADDDMLYPRDWLELLLNAWQADPSSIHCFRAHRIGIGDGRLLPYNDWVPCEDREPSHLNFITGVSGVIYPPAYLRYLKQQGKVFMEVCPYGDDIWLSVNALRSGFKIAQIDAEQRLFPKIPGSQKRRLYDVNVVSGLNQVQLRKTYSEADLLALHGVRAASELPEAEAAVS